MNVLAPAQKRQPNLTVPLLGAAGRQRPAPGVGLPLFMQANPTTSAGATLQRQCACPSTSGANDACETCNSGKPLQAKLAIGASDDPLEQEADRVAEQVLAAPAPAAIGGAPMRIQRFTGSPRGDTGTAPDSVDCVLAGSGRRLEPALQQDMEQRFGHDFSQVRVHSDGAAEQSARDVNANAYTVGHDIVFGEGRFAPETREGQRLIAHELTHVVQQSGAEGIGPAGSYDKRTLSPLSPVTALPPGLRVQAQEAKGGKGDAAKQTAQPEKPIGPALNIVLRAPGDPFTQDVTDYMKNTRGERVLVIDNIQEAVKVANIAAQVEGTKFGTVRIIGHGSTTGGIMMTPTGETSRRWVTAQELEIMGADKTLRTEAKGAMAEGATVEFWGCYIGSNKETTGALSNIFQSDVKAIDSTLRTQSETYTRRPDHKDEIGEVVPGRPGTWMTVISTDEIDFRVKKGNKGLGDSFNRWLLAQGAKLEADGDLPPHSDAAARLTAMRTLFNRSGGKIKRALITGGGNALNRGNKKWEAKWIKTKKP